MQLIIFGTGIAGRAIYREKSIKHNIIAFIENNNSLHNSYYDKKVILPVEQCKNLSFDKIVLSGVWAETMSKQLLDLGISEDKIWHIPDNELNFSTKSRIEETDDIIKELSLLFKEANISYAIEGSSLLSLLRGNNLSAVPDVDILIKSQKDFQLIWKLIQNSVLLQKQKLTKVIYKKNRILTKKGEIDKIIIKSQVDERLREPTVIDINLAVDIGNYYIMDYSDDYYLYFNKEYVDGENIFKYKDMQLLIPYREEEYVTLLYGKEWKEPAKKWSFLDYSNLLNSNQLLQFMEKQR